MNIYTVVYVSGSGCEVEATPCGSLKIARAVAFKRVIKEGTEVDREFTVTRKISSDIKAELITSGVYAHPNHINPALVLIRKSTLKTEMPT